MVNAEAKEIFSKLEIIYPEYRDDFAKAKKEWPSLPSGFVLKLLGTIAKFPDDWDEGKRMQRALPPYTIPYKTECEMGAGLWDRLTGGKWRDR